MDARSEDSIRAEIAEIEAIPYAAKSEHHLKRLNDLEGEIRRRHPELLSSGSGGTVDVIPTPKAVMQSTIEGGHHAMLTLQYGTNPPVTENFLLLDTGCKPDLYIPRELADRLGVPEQVYRQGMIIGAGDIQTPTPYFVKPVTISFSSGRDTLRETVSTKTYVTGGQNIVGRDAMRRLRIGIPENPGTFILYHTIDEDEVL